MDNNVVAIDGVASMTVNAPAVLFDETSWTPAGNITFEQWYEVGATLQTIKGSINWWLGDWMNFGERVYGETYAQAIEVTGAEYQWLADCKWVAGRVPKDVRLPELSWSHHRAVSKIDDPDDQLHCLNVAAEQHLNVKQTTAYVQEFLHPSLPTASPPPVTSPGENPDILPALASADMSGLDGDGEDDDGYWANVDADGVIVDGQTVLPDYLLRQAEQEMFDKFETWWATNGEAKNLDIASARTAWIAAWNLSAMHQEQQNKFSSREENWED